MNQGVCGSLTVAILDYNRPKESELCVRSIKQCLQVKDAKIMFLANGGDQTHARKFYDEGLIDTLILNRENWGCGIATKQLFQAATTEWVLYVQSDQYCTFAITDELFTKMVDSKNKNPNVFLIDLAGNQGQGNYSERAHLIRRADYLSIPGIDDVIGGPGPWANNIWTEEFVQKYMREMGLNFITMTPTLFIDNGAWSEREYPLEYGFPESGKPRTRHRTDTKQLWILSPFSKRVEGFPNLVLNNDEWTSVLSGAWVDGTVPERDKPHSFQFWP